jgi:3-hydroxyacyl-[acyl-carrier-protein] dehydratase
MLQDKLFTFTDIVIEEGTLKTNIELNPAHPIFNGHFPDQPILPGVCMMQIVKEALETYIQKPTRLVKGLDLKFLAMIIPGEGKLIRLELKAEPADQQIKVTAGLFDGANQLFKFKGIFEESSKN